MTAELAWVFDPLPASGRREGGTAATYVFTPTLDTFVREVLQNAHDQRAGGDPVHVSFSLVELTGSHKDHFLERIAWGSLTPHLEGTAQGSTRAAPMIRDALTDIEDEPLTLLVVSDYGSHGLTGDEQGDGNFNALCRDTLMTTEDRASRGGSHGLGKAVLWRFSRFSTVLFSSVLNLDERPYRLFGRTELPYHKTESSEWAGPGWWGQRVTTDRGDRAESVWNADAREATSGTPLERTSEQGTGTTVTVLGFHEPEQEDARPLETVAQDLLQSAARWFWPSITQEPRSLNVTASVRRNDEEPTFSQEAQLTPDLLPFKLALTEESPSERALDPMEVAERPVKIEIPALKDPGPDEPSGKVESEAHLRLIRAGEREVDATYRNKVALVRGSGMVVQYWQPSRMPMEGGAFHAVLLAGEAHSSADEDHAIEKFLRASEPPAHDSWVHHTDQVKNNYKPGAKARLDELWNRLGDAVIELTQSEPPNNIEGPQMLAKMFPIGDVGTPSPARKKFALDTQAAPEDDCWVVKGTVERRTDEAVPWRVDISLWLDGDSASRSKDDALAVVSIEVTDGGGTSDARTDSGAGVIDVPGDLERVSYTATSEPTALDVLRRTRLRADVRATHLEDRN